MNNINTISVKNNISLGSWIQLPDTFAAEIMAKARFDWLAIDMEHGLIDLNNVFKLIQTIRLAGSVPFVRLHTNDSSTIRRVMDAGASGVIVPMVNSKQDAIDAVNALKYSPVGNRSYGLGRAHEFGGKFVKYIESSNNESILVVQIESIEAVKNLEEILTVKEINAIIIGPYDLSGSMGKPGQFDDPQFVDVLNEIKSKVLKTDIALGLHIVFPDKEVFNQKVSEGYTFIAYGMDTIYLKENIEKSIDSLNR